MYHLLMYHLLVISICYLLMYHFIFGFCLNFLTTLPFVYKMNSAAHRFLLSFIETSQVLDHLRKVAECTVHNAESTQFNSESFLPERIRAVGPFYGNHHAYDQLEGIAAEGDNWLTSCLKSRRLTSRATKHGQKCRRFHRMFSGCWCKQ